MKLSVIVPTFNEENYINELIASISAIDDVEKEIVIVDGGSSDKTRDIIEVIQKKKSNIRLIENEAKYVSQGFNKAFDNTDGEYLALIGAHSIYPKGYFSKCIQAIESGVCDVAGGFLIQKGRSNKGQGIANAMSSKFGVGDTEFRTKPTATYVDSVAFAVYPRRIFSEVGLFDTDLIRNQDDEFHYRLNKHGLKIMMLPELKTVYFVRESFNKLFKQYFDYGYYKPLVFKKIKYGIRLRHVIPSLFVLYLVTLPIALFNFIYLVPAAAYLILAVYSSLKVSSGRTALYTFLTFPVLHAAYGLGYIKGLWKWR